MQQPEQNAYIESLLSGDQTPTAAAGSAIASTKTKKKKAATTTSTSATATTTKKKKNTQEQDRVARKIHELQVMRQYCADYSVAFLRALASKVKMSRPDISPEEMEQHRVAILAAEATMAVIEVAKGLTRTRINGHYT